MYTSYNGAKGRSKSTMDVFRATEEASQPGIGSLTMSRYGRRRRTQAPPQIKRARSYLSDDIRRQFELGFENSATSSRTAPVATQSPNSSSFVKRLVATLERRQREGGVKYTRSLEDDFCGTSYRQCSKDHVDDVSRIRKKQPDKERIFLERFNSDLALPRDPYYSQPRHRLERLPERDNEDEEGESSGFESRVNAPAKQSWENAALLPTHVPRISGDNPPKASARRLLKSVLSTIIGWRGAKTLPRGSRDYYATRESLGEEMRAFRRDTMPRLIERAAVADRFQRAAPERNDQREFAELIGSSRHLLDGAESSIATIRPVYGNNAITRQRRGSSYQEHPPSDEAIYGSRKIQPPAAPTRAVSSQSAEHLLRPSKVKDLQKRPPHELESVQLRRRPGAESSVVYDVPRWSHRMTLPEESGKLVAERSRTPPKYENISGFINDDKRMRCTMFTTF